MYVKFSNTDGASFSMYEKDATALILKMGQSGKIPSAISSEDLPAALSSLEKALQEQKDALSGGSAKEEEDEPVNDNVRAYPLLQLLKTSIANKKSILWDRTSVLL